MFSTDFRVGITAISITRSCLPGRGGTLSIFCFLFSVLFFRDYPRACGRTHPSVAI